MQKNSIKDGSASFVGFGSVLLGYFGVQYMDAIGSIIIAGYIFLHGTYCTERIFIGVA